MIRLRDGFVINPDTFWKPAYRISPYTTNYTQINKRIIDQGVIDYDLVNSFFGQNFYPTLNGRSAIALALNQYDLDPTDEVMITTTSGNRYISSCVTNEIDKICKWSMKLSNQTKLIFVNHEFGFCYQELESLKKYGLPIIEDRALSFSSNDKTNSVGNTGDFVIYSLPKFFPVSFGGVLQCNNPSRMKYLPAEDQQLKSYFFSLVTNYLPQTEAGVFMFRTKKMDVNEFKKFMQSNGVESSVFYGENAFFIPVHQGLCQEDMDFFYSLTSYFMENGNE